MPAPTDPGDGPAADKPTPSLARRRRRTGQHFTTEQRDALMPQFLDALKIGGTVSEACRQTGVHRSTAYDWRNKYPAFAEAWAEADLDADDVIRGALIQHGVLGVERSRPIYHQGVLVGTETWREYSPRVLLAIAAARMPEYRPRHELSGPAGGPIETKRVNDDSPERITEIVDILRSAGAFGPGAADPGDDAEDDALHSDDEA